MLLRTECAGLQGRMVLLAEDNLINQRVAKMMLSSLGMTVEVVSNGQEAVDAVKRRFGQHGDRQFDVLLMDMAMPVMGGVDATKVLIPSCFASWQSSALHLVCLSCVSGCSAVKIERISAMSQACPLTAASMPRLHICCMFCHPAASHWCSVSLLPCAPCFPATMWNLGYCITDFNGHVYTIAHVHGGGMLDAVLTLCGGCGFCCLSKGSALHKCKAFALHDNLFLNHNECLY